MSESGYVQEITDSKIHLKKEPIKYMNSAIGVLGPPGAGKSSICCAYYKTQYNMDNNYFKISSSNVSFTKGIWMLKESERMNIKGNIERDILDCEGFQVDEIKSWKYVMIISFICSEIIILNRNTRLDDTKKVLNIIKNSLLKMRESNIPKLLKKIYIQMKKTKDFDDFDNQLKEIGFQPDSIENVVIKPILIPNIGDDTLEDNDNNILKVKKYLNQVKESFNNIAKNSIEQSISTFVKYIDNLNMALDGKMSFNSQEIINDLKNEYETCYATWYNKKKIELQNKNLYDLDDINETFEEFLNKQHLDFTFKENLNELTFFGSSNEFDQYYKSFGKNKDFKVDKEIFRDAYDSKKNEKQSQLYLKETGNVKEKGKIGLEYQKVKNEIDRYFGNLKFYDSIDSKYDHCYLNVNTDLLDVKQEKLNELYEYYEKKRKEKKNDWENQIQRAKWRSVCQVEGTLKCVNGHKLNNNPIKCSECDGTLYWVDGKTRYTICDNCKLVSRCESCVCSRCKGRSLCNPKFTDFVP